MTNSLKILLVEDNPANQALMLKQMKLLGYQIETAMNGQDALSKLADQRYDFVFTDCHMPVMDGFEMTRRLRNLEAAGERVPVIAITADAMDGTREKCLEAGMDNYLTKPIQIAALKSLITELLEGTAANSLSVEPSVPESASSAEVIDPKALPEMLGVSDRESLVEFYNSFVSIGRNVMADLKKCYESGDLQAVGDQGHKLKSSSRAVGANRLADCCLALEQHGRGGDQAAVDACMQQIERLFEEACDWINKFTAH